LADWLEKFSVAALAVGLFQDKEIGIVVAAVAFCGCMLLTRKMEGRT
jgi:hypothetical protein